MTKLLKPFLSDRLSLHFEGNFLGLVVLVLCGISSAVFADEFTAKKGSLSAEYPQEVIQSNAKKGKFIPVKMAKKPVSASVFHAAARKTVAEGGTVFVIGVLVNANSEQWPNDELTAHIRAVHKITTEIVIGNPDTDTVGLAEEYGVMIHGVIPVIYDPNDSLTVTKKDKKIDVPLKLGNVLLAFNDHDYAYKNEGALIDSVDELRPHMMHYLEKGKHLVSAAEFTRQQRAYLTELHEEMDKLNREIDIEKAGIARLNADSLEALLLRGFTSSQTFRPSTAEGRENRKTVEEYFHQHGLEINKQHYDLHVMLDTLAVYTIGLHRRGCDVGDAESCTALASSYEHGDGVEVDLEQASRLFHQGCEGGSSLACKKVAQ